MLPPSKTGLPRRPLRFSLHRSHRGGALLELAVSIPLLLLFVMGVVDYARLYYASIAVTNAAMAGAQAGQNPLNTSDSIVVQAQRDAGSVILDSVQTVRFCRCPDTGVVDCSPGDCGAYGQAQQYDSVRVRKDVSLLIRYLGLPDRITVVRTAVLRSN